MQEGSVLKSFSLLAEETINWVDGQKGTVQNSIYVCLVLCY